ncbi:MAG TPA: UDP-N-acetylmuramate dehydrogenase [Marinospirillum sp.]|uniref:UDP-N-acetylmuramate dehydrogenase n=1 Tax=Marinospirillum sp. TaxID=2183934 RepID=UPI002B4A3222|nr:UDP-N-acetylmuramate dehydrogenase [Marinospirillum sp.]HKM15183.1 UDP-N-acetylmuramate dehydrogenase [Marinospirillum sp.]
MFRKTANAPLNQRNTLGFTAQASWLVKAEQPNELPEIFDFALSQQLPVFPLGGGSNVIFQGDLKAVVLQQQAQVLDWPEIEPDELILSVPAGYSWQQLVLDTTNKGYFGLENLALIPGQAGAAPIQNIGAYGVELADSLQAVEGYWLPKKGQPAKFAIIAAKDCALGYRDSRFKHDWKGRFVITALQLQLSKQAEPRLNYADLKARLAIKLDLTTKKQQPEALNQPLPRLIAEVVSELRRSKLPDPAKLGNAGSFFKNPVISQQQAEELLTLYPKMPHYPATNGCKLAAAWLIDQCGFKGAKRGSVGVHDQQALVLVHSGGGTAENLLALAEEITTAVKTRFNVQLEREPELVLVK